MDQPLDISDVARRTGLTSRALRFYEARGLVSPLRTFNGRRFYGAAELERLNQIVTLKRAGLSLTQIGAVLQGRPINLAALIDARLAVIADQERTLRDAAKLLLSVKSRIDRGEPVDAATFCSLIINKEPEMTVEQWNKVTDKFFSPEQKAHWAEKLADMPATFDQADYNAKWADLGTRAAAVMPLGPDSPEAQAIYDEWQALLAPFTAVASPEMMQGATKLYERMGEWQGDVQAPFGSDVFAFVQEVGRRRKASA